MKYIKSSLLIFLTLSLLQSCRVTETYKLGEEFEIELENEGTGGYEWNFIKVPEIIVLDSSDVVLSEKDELTRYNKKFTLKGTKKGTYNLTFHHLRSFEKLDTVPENLIKTFKIRIKK